MADARAPRIGRVLARAHEGALEQQRREGRDQQQGQRVGIGAPNQGRDLFDHDGDGATEHQSHRHGAPQGVAPFDVRQFVRQHAPQGTRVKAGQEVGGDQDGRVVRVTPGGKGVGDGRVKDSNPGHRHPRLSGQLDDEGAQPGRVA